MESVYVSLIITHQQNSKVFLEKILKAENHIELGKLPNLNFLEEELNNII